MADISIAGAVANIKYHDNGDGTYSPTTFDTGGTGTSPKVAGLEYNSTPPTLTDGGTGALQGDSSGNLKVTQAALQAGEDLPNGVMKTEQRFGVLDMNSNGHFTADGLAKAGVGFLHRVLISQPASAVPTAGVLTLYNSTSETGGYIFKHYIPNSAITTPISIEVNCAFSQGCYVSFDATLAGVEVTLIGR